MSFPRKRAVTACETCRVRKIKCDNERPQCSSCLKRNLPCSYDPRLDHSSFDPASLLILEKLDNTLQKLNDLSNAVCANPVQSQAGFPAAVNVTKNSQPLPQTVGQDNLSQPGSNDCLEVPTAFASTDCVLTWPVFGGRWPQDYLSLDLLVGNFQLTHTNGEQASDRRDKRPCRGISEEEIPRLVEQFLGRVHSKNPIFHTRQIREDARRVAEDGVRWDASSCVVLLACALGAIARPFDPSCEVGQLHGRTSVEEAADYRETAEAYFQVARKRLGLLEASIIAGQCYMLSGIYLMYTMRPLQGWQAFHQAGSAYSLYLKGQASIRDRSDNSNATPGAFERRLEQRLYWTVLKSECEIREELDLPQSDLCRLGYPYLFPSPPTPGSPIQKPQDAGYTQTPASTTTASSQILSMASSLDRQHFEEQSWFYYLSEIALRRIENRVLHKFYKEDHHCWSQVNIQTMISDAKDIEAQLAIWHSYLPEAIRFDNLPPDRTLDELRQMTQGRRLGIRILLYRPFLYYAVHCAHDPSSSTSNLLEGFVQKALDVCLESNAGNSMTHRHHGTWYGLRMITSTGLMLIAARMSNLIDWYSPSQNGEIQENEYARALQNCLEKLRYWEAESSDIAQACKIIEELLGMVS